MTPRVLVAGEDGPQRQWLRHHLQTLWPECEPPCLDLQQLQQKIATVTVRQYDAVLLCASFGGSTREDCEGFRWLRQLRRECQLPPLVVVAAQGNELTAVRALRLGAAEYLPRDLLDAQLLARTLRKVAHGTRRRLHRSARPARRRQPTAIPRYTLLRELGTSARASVWLARSEALERHVALKISRPVPGEAADTQQFACEYAAIAALRDPAVVDIYDYGVHDGREFLAMEYFPCGDLKQRLLHPLSDLQAVSYTRRIASALQVVHQAGMLHRDLKPPNIMLRGDGSPVLIDFGLAKRVNSDTQNTAIGVLRGSPYYMSPEQVQAQTLDVRSDLYSLGVVFYELLTGRKPFHGQTAMELMQQHVTGERPTLPAHLSRYEPLLARMMAREREQRCADAAEVLAALAELPDAAQGGAAHAA